MSKPEIRTISDQIWWSYANLARAHAALEKGRQKYIRTDHIIRARLFSGLQSGTMSIRSVYDDERLKLLAPQACVYCHATEQLTLDHLIPRIRGGTDDLANLVPACRRCNSSKRGADFIIWHEKRGSFPPLLLLRRYLKLIHAYCEENNLLNKALTAENIDNLPFDLQALPLDYPPLPKLRL